MKKFLIQLRKTRLSLTLITLFLLLLISLGLVLFFVAQARFREPGPAVPRPQYSVTKIKRDEGNAFFILRGMAAAAHLNAFDAGLNAAQRDLDIYAKDAIAAESDEIIKANFPLMEKPDWTIWNCALPPKYWQTIMRDRQHIQTKIAANAVGLKRLAEMQALPRYQEYLPPGILDGSAYYAHFRVALDMHSTLAIIDIQDENTAPAILRLTNDHIFLRKLLANSGTLISRRVMLATMHKQLQDLDQILERASSLRPADIQALRQAFVPLTAAEGDLSAVLQHQQQWQTVSFDKADWQRHLRFAFELEGQLDAIHLKLRAINEGIDFTGFEALVREANKLSTSVKLIWDANSRQLSLDVEPYRPSCGKQVLALNIPLNSQGVKGLSR
ncbi:hypothetical protein H8K35_10030 [Undibacterium sp. LX40W]|uniref:Uncharacterized protein n=1 Tax=Undibacterium nitidum TaxID=2762298 RepID=A0A923HVC3_9BURK|nr:MULTISPECIES: hypothetical protein [Undibacterium]MBC3882009.1 hypothetical protein [Undibacterium nitidum]MBC3891995.1 hypothetical protein [Undibacterium sp. LX40W]